MRRRLGARKLLHEFCDADFKPVAAGLVDVGGMTLSKVGGYLFVVSVLKGSPAEGVIAPSAPPDRNARLFLYSLDPPKRLPAIHEASFAAYEVGLRRPRVQDGKSLTCVVGSEGVVCSR